MTLPFAPLSDASSTELICDLVSKTLATSLHTTEKPSTRKHTQTHIQPPPGLRAPILAVDTVIKQVRLMMQMNVYKEFHINCTQNFKFHIKITVSVRP